MDYLTNVWWWATYHVSLVFHGLCHMTHSRGRPDILRICRWQLKWINWQINLTSYDIIHDNSTSKTYSQTKLVGYQFAEIYWILRLRNFFLKVYNTHTPIGQYIKPDFISIACIRSNQIMYIGFNFMWILDVNMKMIYLYIRSYKLWCNHIPYVLVCTAFKYTCVCIIIIIGRDTHFCSIYHTVFSVFQHLHAHLYIYFFGSFLDHITHHHITFKTHILSWQY